MVTHGSDSPSTSAGASPAGAASQRDRERIFLGLGSNLGDRARRLAAARRGLERAGVRLVAASPVYVSEPVGVAGHPPYLNQVVEARTTLPPSELLALGRALERAAGRESRSRGGVRELDVDLLLYGPRLVARPGLVLPHPRLHERRFVLVPLVRLAPWLVHPRLGRTVAALLATCPDRSWLYRWHGAGATGRRGDGPRLKGRRRGRYNRARAAGGVAGTAVR